MNRGFELGSYLGLGILLNALFLVGVKSKSVGTSDYHRIIVRHFAKWCKYKKTASRKDCGAKGASCPCKPRPFIFVGFSSTPIKWEGYFQPYL